MWGRRDRAGRMKREGKGREGGRKGKGRNGRGVEREEKKKSESGAGT